MAEGFIFFTSSKRPFRTVTYWGQCHFPFSRRFIFRGPQITSRIGNRAMSFLSGLFSLRTLSVTPSWCFRQSISRKVAYPPVDSSSLRNLLTTFPIYRRGLLLPPKMQAIHEPMRADSSVGGLRYDQSVPIDDALVVVMVVVEWSEYESKQSFNQKILALQFALQLIFLQLIFFQFFLFLHFFLLAHLFLFLFASSSFFCGLLFLLLLLLARLVLQVAQELLLPWSGSRFSDAWWSPCPWADGSDQGKTPRMFLEFPPPHVAISTPDTTCSQGADRVGTGQKRLQQTALLGRMLTGSPTSHPRMLPLLLQVLRRMLTGSSTSHPRMLPLQVLLCSLFAV